MLIISLFIADYLNIEVFPLTQNLLRDIVIGTLAVLPPFALFLFTLSERAKKVPLIGSIRSIVMNEVRDIFSNCTLFDLILISLLAGIGEELLFRGVLQVKLGIIAASIIFGLAHYISLAYVILTIIMGLYIGFLFNLTGSLLVVIQLHFIYDLVALVYLKYMTFTDRSSIQV